MKALKSFFLLILIFIGVKACSFVTQTLVVANSAENSSSSGVPSQGPYPAEGEIAGFERAYFAHNLSLAYPNDWYILSKADVANVRSAAEGMVGAYKVHKDTVLSAVANEDSALSGAQVRVSFQDQAFSQQELSGATRHDLDFVCAEHSASLSGPNLPIQIIGTPECEKVMLGDKLAISIKYDRTGAENMGPSSVTIFQIPLEESIALITVSHKMDSAAGSTAVENIINSIRTS